MKAVPPDVEPGRRGRETSAVDEPPALNPSHHSKTRNGSPSMTPEERRIDPRSSELADERNQKRPWSPSPRLVIAARVLLLVWAGFWTYFVIGASITGGATSIPYASWVLGILTGLCVCAWFRPRLGGRLLLVAGVASALFFRDGFTSLTLTVPAFILGLAFFQIGDIASVSARREDRLR